MQQLLAWAGVLLKAFDMGAKWASIAIILNVFTGIPVAPGILASAAISIFYIVLGGLWAAAATELVQFFIQLLAGIAMFAAVLSKLGGTSAIFGMWRQLPAGTRPRLTDNSHRAFLSLSARQFFELQRRHLEPGPALPRLAHRARRSARRVALRCALPLLAPHPILSHVGRADPAAWPRGSDAV